MAQEKAKPCSTCGHKYGWDECDLVGKSISVARKNKDICGKNSIGWIPKIGFLKRIFILFWGS